MKKTITLLLAFLLLLSCSGCGSKTLSQSDKPVSLVIIAGRHANANMFTDDMLKITRELIESTIVKSTTEKGYHVDADVSLIICDGNPRKVALESEGHSLLTFDAPNAVKYEDGKKKMVNGILDFLIKDEIKADDPEVDLLAAIAQAQDILNSSSRKETEHQILILDTGITTAGYLNMVSLDVIEMDTMELVSAIQEGIPDLEGTMITFLGLGNVCMPQPQIRSNSGRSKLVDLWTAIIETAGKGKLTDKLYISENYGEPMQYTEEGALDGTGYPQVLTVFFSSEDLIADRNPNPIDNQKENTDDGTSLVFKLYTADLGFQADTAEFRNKDQVYNVLNLIKPDLEKVLKGTNCKLYVVGSIAKVTADRTDRTNTVSKDRAQAIADLLIQDYRVPQDRIVVVDAGVTEFSWRNADESNGPREENRVVAIFSDNTDQFNELINKGYLK